MKVSHYWQLRSLHPLSNWSSRRDTTGLKLPSFAFLGSTSQRGHNGRTLHCARGQLTDHIWGNDLAHRLIWGQSMILLKFFNWREPLWRSPQTHITGVACSWTKSTGIARNPNFVHPSPGMHYTVNLQCDCNGFAHHAQDFFLLHSFPQATSFSSLLAVAGGLLADLLVTVIFK